jgi:ABC-type multidrug transport system ATPase subunit
VITVRDLTRRFGPHTAIEGLSFHLEPGEVVGFLGPNGAGKSTTMRILSGYLPATSGSAEVAGFDVLRSSLEVRRRIGYLPESVPLYAEHRVEEMSFSSIFLADGTEVTTTYGHWTPNEPPYILSVRLKLSECDQRLTHR